MCEQHEKAYFYMKRFIVKMKKIGKLFTIWDLEEYVFKNAGTIRIAPGRRVSDWIKDAKSRGKIFELAQRSTLLSFNVENPVL